MERENAPYVGTWYETPEGDLFVILSYDKERGLIDIQYAGGRVDRIDAPAWATLEAQEVEPPEEWRPSMDDFPAGRRRKS